MLGLLIGMLLVSVLIIVSFVLVFCRCGQSWNRE